MREYECECTVTCIEHLHVQADTAEEAREAAEKILEGSVCSSPELVSCECEALQG